MAGVLLLFVFLVVLLLGRTYPSDAALFPTLVGGAGALLGLLFLVLLVFHRAEPAGASADADTIASDRRSFWIALLASPVYSVSIYIAGFYVATFAAMAVMPYLLGFRHILWLLMIAFLMVVVLHLVFVVAMEIDLPLGLAGDFYLRHFVYQD